VRVLISKGAWLFLPYSDGDEVDLCPYTTLKDLRIINVYNERS
jgi:hypothetical protein